jgi:hypothetical protein
MQQNGYRAAGLAAFLPVFSVLDPAVGSLLGLLLYHEHLGGGTGRIAAEAVAVLAATWGITRLARSTAEAEPIEPMQPVRRRRLVAQRPAFLPAAHVRLAAAAIQVADPLVPLADPFPGAPEEPPATR